MRISNSPIGSLMTEHRQIERVLAVMVAEGDRIDRTSSVDSDRVEAIAEFLSVYGDRNHHGKEEDILFARLAQKELQPEFAQSMERLIEGHRYARGQVQRLRAANERAREGDVSAAAEIRDAFRLLAEFYPEHIEDEDHRFFKPAMNHFTAEEREQLQRDFEAFDRQLLHDVYDERLAALEAAVERQPAGA